MKVDLVFESNTTSFTEILDDLFQNKNLLETVSINYYKNIKYAQSLDNKDYHQLFTTTKICYFATKIDITLLKRLKLAEEQLVVFVDPEMVTNEAINLLMEHQVPAMLLTKENLEDLKQWVLVGKIPTITIKMTNLYEFDTRKRVQVVKQDLIQSKSNQEFVNSLLTNVVKQKTPVKNNAEMAQFFKTLLKNKSS